MIDFITFAINESYKMFVYDPTDKWEWDEHLVKCIGKTKHYVTFELVNGLRIKKKIRTCVFGEFVEYSTTKSKHTLMSYDVLIRAWNTFTL